MGGVLVKQPHEANYVILDDNVNINLDYYDNADIIKQKTKNMSFIFNSFLHFEKDCDQNQIK